jgi:hypothetical protein
VATSDNPEGKLDSNPSVNTGISSDKSEVAEPAEWWQQLSETGKEKINSITLLHL